MALTPDLELKYRSLKHHIQWKDLIGLHPLGRQESHQEAFCCSILSQYHLELFSLPKSLTTPLENPLVLQQYHGVGIQILLLRNFKTKPESILKYPAGSLYSVRISHPSTIDVIQTETKPLISGIALSSWPYFCSEPLWIT